MRRFLSILPGAIIALAAWRPEAAPTYRLAYDRADTVTSKREPPVPSAGSFRAAGNTFEVASIILSGAGKTPGGGGGGSYTAGPLDVAGTAKECWSERPCTAALADGTHTFGELTRASDSHKCKILMTTAGLWGNTASCGTSGENGTLWTTWCASTTCTIDQYDGQIGGVPYVQSTLASQATVAANCINTSLPCGAFSGSQNYTISLSSTAQPLSISFVAERTLNFGTAQNILSDGSTSAIYFNTAGLVSNFFGSGFDAMATDSAFHAVQVVIDDAHSNSSMQVDGGAPVTGGAGPNALAANVPLGGPTAAKPHMNFVEMILWGRALTSTEENNLHANQSAFWGTP